MFKTINSKFIIFTVIFILLSVGIPASFLISQFGANFEQRSIVMLESTLDVVNSCVLNAMYLGRHNDVQQIVNNIGLNRAVDHIRIINPAGNITQSSDSGEIGMNINKISPGHLSMNSSGEENIKFLRPERVYSVTRAILNDIYCQSCHGTDPVIAYLDVDTDLTQAERYFYTGSTHMIFLAIAIVIMLSLRFYILKIVLRAIHLFSPFEIRYSSLHKVIYPPRILSIA